MKKSKTENNVKKSAEIGKKSHDALFTSAMSDLRVAQDFFEQYLPQPLLTALDLQTLALCKDKFVNDNLKAKVTDMLYQVAFKAGQDSYLRVLVEHQSTASEDMPLRVLEYENHIMRQAYRDTGKFPLVYTVVYYNGKVRWPYATDLKALINAPADLISLYALKPFQLIDLNEIKDEELRHHVWSGVMSLVMKHIYARDVLPYLPDIFALLQKIERLHGQTFVRAMVYYLYTEGEINDEDKFKSLIKNNLSYEVEVDFMTLAEKHFQERFQYKAQEVENEAIKKVAKNMLIKGLDVVIVAETTGMDINALKQMKDDNKI